MISNVNRLSFDEGCQEMAADKARKRKRWSGDPHQYLGADGRRASMKALWGVHLEVASGNETAAEVGGRCGAV